MIAPIDDSSNNILYFTLNALGDRNRWMDALREIRGLDDEESTVTLVWRNAKIITRPSTARAWIEGALDTHDRD